LRDYARHAAGGAPLRCRQAALRHMAPDAVTIAAMPLPHHAMSPCRLYRYRFAAIRHARLARRDAEPRVWQSAMSRAMLRSVKSAAPQALPYVTAHATPSQLFAIATYAFAA